MRNEFNIPIDPFFAQQGRDPLAELIVEAHRNGIEVIPWFEFGFSTSYSSNGGHIITKYPEWAARNSAGQLVVKNGFDWMNGLHPGPQAFMLSLVNEVITNYDVDGVQGDDRLPAMPTEGGYDPWTLQQYRAEHNGANPPTNTKDSNWLYWRSDRMVNFLGRMFRMVKVPSKSEAAPKLVPRMKMFTPVSGSFVPVSMTLPVKVPVWAAAAIGRQTARKRRIGLIMVTLNSEIRVGSRSENRSWRAHPPDSTCSHPRRERPCCHRSSSRRPLGYR
jgi:hypothetical protein